MKKRQIKEIENLKQQLYSLGYYHFQVDSLVRETVHTGQLEKLSVEELKRLEKELESYIEFALKCFKKTGNL
jgi:hypothetical protein